MPLLRAVRDVIANLAARADPTAVRPGANAESSAGFKRRLLEIEVTESFLGEVRPKLDARLHSALERSIAHIEVPITSLSALLERVRTVRTGQAIAVGRSGWSESHTETKYAYDLAALVLALESMVRESTPESGCLGTSSGSSPSAA